MSNASEMAMQRKETAPSSSNGDLGDRSSAEPRMSLKPPKQLDFEAPRSPPSMEEMEGRTNTVYGPCHDR